MLDVKKLLAKVLEALSVDYITEQGVNGDWHYRKWKSGKIEAWGHHNCGSVAITTASDTYGGYRSGDVQLPIPSGIFTATPHAVLTKVGSQAGTIYFALPRSATLITFIIGGSQRSLTATNQYVSAYCWQD